MLVGTIRLIAAWSVLSVFSGVLCHAAAGSTGTVTIPARPEPITLNLSKTALIVADMQNAYVSRGGLWDRLGQDISGARAAVENTAKLLSAARRAGVAVIYLKMKVPHAAGRSDETDSPAFHKGATLATMAGRPGFKGRQMMQNPWNEEIVADLKPQASDIVIEKSTYSGFGQTTLDRTLKEMKISNLIITGVATNVCVESTVRDAYTLNYWPVLVSDGVNSIGPAYTQQATFWNVITFFGWVANTSDIVSAFSSN